MMKWLVKTLGVWFVLVAAAILNGLLREQVFNPALGPEAALPLSGITLALAIFLITWLLVPVFGPLRPGTYLVTGLIWVGLTLAFEYLFGHYVLGKPWQAIHAVFDVGGGNLFILALLSAGLSPCLAGKLRGMI